MNTVTRAGTVATLMVVLAAAPGSSAPSDGRLLDAVKQGDRAAVRALLARRADPNMADPDETTALYWATQQNDLETARLLLSAGANVRAASRYGVAPLSIACVNGNRALVEALLDAGADPDTAMSEGETVLMTASRTGVEDVVNALLARGASINTKERSSGQTAVMWAAGEGHVQVVKALIDHGADIAARSNGSWTALLFAVREGRLDVVRTLLGAGADVNDALIVPRTGKKGSTALMIAIGNANYEIAALLLDKGADPNTFNLGWGPLHHLTFVRKPGQGSTGPGPTGSGTVTSLELARTLVSHGANPNARMTQKAPGGVVGVTELNMKGATPFLMASRSADVPLMRLLAELGADPRLANDEGSTPLIVAAGVGTHSPAEDPGTEEEVLGAVKLALELGNDIDATDNNGNSAMHGAAFKQVPAVVQYLADRGAKIEIWDRKNAQGWTPLRIAAGVFRGGMYRFHLETADRLRQVMTAAGISTILEPEVAVRAKTAKP